MGLADALVELARQVRTDTVRILEATPREALHWAPSGMSNTILWHAGHALWLQDLMCIEVLAGQSELPKGWADYFAQGSRPARVTHWPHHSEVLRLLTLQLQRITNLLATATDEQLVRVPARLGTSRNTLGWIIHGLHDEAKHCGEMYLLWKLWTRSAR